MKFFILPDLRMGRSCSDIAKLFVVGIYQRWHQNVMDRSYGFLLKVSVLSVLFFLLFLCTNVSTEIILGFSLDIASKSSS